MQCLRKMHVDGFVVGMVTHQNEDLTPVRMLQKGVTIQCGTTIIFLEKIMLTSHFLVILETVSVKLKKLNKVVCHELET